MTMLYVDSMTPVKASMTKIPSPEPPQRKRARLSSTKVRNIVRYGSLDDYFARPKASQKRTKITTTLYVRSLADDDAARIVMADNEEPCEPKVSVGFQDTNKRSRSERRTRTRHFQPSSESAPSNVATVGSVLLQATTDQSSKPYKPPYVASNNSLTGIHKVVDYRLQKKFETFRAIASYHCDPNSFTPDANDNKLKPNGI